MECVPCCWRWDTNEAILACAVPLGFAYSVAEDLAGERSPGRSHGFGIELVRLQLERACEGGSYKMMCQRHAWNAAESSTSLGAARDAAVILLVVSCGSIHSALTLEQHVGSA